MTKDIGCRVRVADKLDARDFGESERKRRSPGALGEVWLAESDWRAVKHGDGTKATYHVDELTELRAVKVGDKVRTATKLTADFGFLANDSRRPDAVGRVTAELAKGEDGKRVPCFYIMVEHGDGANVPYREDEFTPLDAPVATPEERATDCRKTNRDRWIALNLGAVYVEPSFAHSEAREAVLLDACERLTSQMVDAHRMLDETKVPSCADGRVLNLTERVQVLLAMRDSKQWGAGSKPEPRPRVSRFIVGNDNFRSLFDERGAEVASMWHTGYEWRFHVRVALSKPVEGEGFATAEEAEQAAYAVLRTWADVEGERGAAPKASEGFGGTRVRTLGEAVDGAHVVRLALYSFADGSEVPYLEAHETHDGARAGRVMSLSAAVHLMQNVSDDEVWTIGSREKAGESK